MCCIFRMTSQGPRAGKGLPPSPPARWVMLALKASCLVLSILGVMLCQAGHSFQGSNHVLSNCFQDLAEEWRNVLATGWKRSRGGRDVSHCWGRTRGDSPRHLLPCPSVRCPHIHHSDAAFPKTEFLTYFPSLWVPSCLVPYISLPIIPII